MAFPERIPLIEELEDPRDSRIICLLTSVRQGIPAVMAEDQVRVIFDHLQKIGAKPIPKLDIFLVGPAENRQFDGVGIQIRMPL